jgi:Zn-dependent peptidase ImmA (M78 family)
MLINEINQSETLMQVKKFAQWACKLLNIKNVPTINYSNDNAEVESKRTFGSTTSDGNIWVYIGNRSPADTMRTLVHELVHYKQFDAGLANDSMTDDQRQQVEDVANAMAGRIMRQYGKKYSSIFF